MQIVMTIVKPLLNLVFNIAKRKLKPIYKKITNNTIYIEISESDNISVDSWQKIEIIDITT